MLDRVYNIFLAIWLAIALALNSVEMIYMLVAVLVFEATTGKNIARMISGEAYIENPNAKYSLSAEQLQRFVILLFLYITYFVYPEEAWFGSWFLVLVLFNIGITTVCPAVMLFKSAGFR